MNGSDQPSKRNSEKENLNTTTFQFSISLVPGFIFNLSPTNLENLLPTNRLSYYIFCSVVFIVTAAFTSVKVVVTRNTVRTKLFHAIFLGIWNFGHVSNLPNFQTSKKRKKLNHDSSQVKSCLLGYLPDNQLLSSEIPQEK